MFVIVYSLFLWFFTDSLFAVCETHIQFIKKLERNTLTPNLIWQYSFSKREILKHMNIYAVHKQRD